MSRARAMAHVVLPVPAGPAKSRCGRFPSFAYALRRSTISSWPTTSSRLFGRYFSTQSSFIDAPTRGTSGGRVISLWRGGEPKLLDDDVQGVRDGGDRVDQRRRRAPREQEADRMPGVVDDERSAVATVRKEIAHDLLPEDRRRSAVVHLDDRVDRRDASLCDPGRATALSDWHADLRFLRPADAADPQDLGRDEPRLDRLGDRGVDEVRRAARETFQAPARGVEEGREEPSQEARDRPGLFVLELDRHEIGEARDRVPQAPAVDGHGLQDRVNDTARV